MSRIPLCNPDELPESLQTMRDNAGGIPMMVNVLQGFEKAPELFETFFAWYFPWHANAGSQPTRLSARLKELVRLRIATYTGCRLCKASRQAPDTIPESTAVYIDDPATREHDLSPAEAAALNFAWKFALDHFSLTDDDFNVLRRHFDTAQILELVMMVSVVYLGLGRVLSVLELDNPSCPIPSASPAWVAPADAGMEAQRLYRKSVSSETDENAVV